MPKPRNRITVERLRSLLIYDPENGNFRWRVNQGRMKPGQVAGTKHSRGYRQINIDGFIYLEHRLAWLYVNGVWPHSELDHRNRQKQDNRITALREATRSQNMQNAVQHNSLGLRGVYKNGLRYSARININGKQTYLGTFDTPEQAHATYLIVAEELHGDFIAPIGD